MEKIVFSAEQGLIALAMQDRAVRLAHSRLQPTDFESPINGAIWGAMQELETSGRGVDRITVEDQLQRDGNLRMVGDTLDTLSPPAGRAEDYVEIIKDASTRRQALTLARDIINKADSVPAADLLSELESGVTSIAGGRDTGDYTWAGSLAGAFLDRVHQMADSDGLLGIPTGLTDLDQILSGMQRQNVIILGARPSMGKTALALTIMDNVAVRNRGTVALFSLEMSKEEIFDRLAAVESDVSMQDIRTGRLDRDQWDAINGSLQDINNANIAIDDTPMTTVSEMTSKCRRIKAERGLDLVIIDYLQLMFDDKAENRTQEVSKISRQIKMMAKELDVPVILLSQLSRAPETRTDHRPMLSDLRESGSIEQDADIVLFIYRDAVYNPETDDPGAAEIIVAKHRQGACGTAHVAWIAQLTKFSDAVRGPERETK